MRSKMCPRRAGSADVDAGLLERYDQLAPLVGQSIVHHRDLEAHSVGHLPRLSPVPAGSHAPRERPPQAHPLLVVTCRKWPHSPRPPARTLADSKYAPQNPQRLGKPTSAVSSLCRGFEPCPRLSARRSVRWKRRLRNQKVAGSESCQARQPRKPRFPSREMLRWAFDGLQHYHLSATYGFDEDEAVPLHRRKSLELRRLEVPLYGRQSFVC